MGHRAVTLKTAYQQADPETILSVVWGPAVERSAVNSAPTRPPCAHPPLGRWLGQAKTPCYCWKKYTFAPVAQLDRAHASGA